jgi:hypothetical protein
MFRRLENPYAARVSEFIVLLKKGELLLKRGKRLLLRGKRLHRRGFWCI